MIASPAPRFNPYDRLTFYRLEAKYGSPIALELAASDELRFLEGYAPGAQFVLENVTGALIPTGGASQLVVPPDLLERLVSEGALRPCPGDNAWMLERWFHRRRKYLPELYSAVHRARSALRRVRAFDRLTDPTTADVYKQVFGGTDAVSVLRFPSAGHAP